MLLCIDWTDPSIIAAFIELGGIMLTSIISIWMVFCQINKQKEVDDKRYKIQLLEDFCSIVFANMDSVIHSYKVFNESRKKDPKNDTEKNWAALQTLTLPRIEEAAKILNKVEVVFCQKDNKLSTQEIEDSFLSSISALNKGVDYDKDAYTKAKKDLQKQVKDMLKNLAK